MAQDPIIDEIRRRRLETERACGADWQRLIDLYRSFPVGDHRIVEGSPRLLKPPTESGRKNPAR